MLDFVLRPLRYVLGAGEREVSKPLDETEHELGDAVGAVHRSDSIDHHVEVIAAAIAFAPDAPERRQPQYGVSPTLEFGGAGWCA